MRIAILYLSLLFISGSSFAQVADLEPRRSSNIEPYRSYMLPGVSAEQAASDEQEAMRYAISVDSWSKAGDAQEATFTSSFATPFSWLGRQSIISIESASAPYTLSVGDKVVGSNLNSAMPAQFNITNFIESEVETPITITMYHDAASSTLEAWKSNNTFTLGKVVMLSQPTMYIRDIQVETTLSSGVLNTTIAVIVKSQALNPRSSRINFDLISPAGNYILRGSTDVNLSMRQEDTVRLFASVPDSLAWSAENPNLYRLNLSTQHRGRHLEYLSFDVGLRSIDINKNGELSINGQPQNLKVAKVNSSIEIETLSELKSKGYNTVKIAAGDHNRAIYNYADSAGLYIITTAPINTSHSGDNILRGGNPTNDPARREEYIERVDAIYNLTKLHPSVLAFSIADTSLNGFNLYESYLYLKDRERQRPIIYLNSEEQWNNDRLKIEM
ncbi:MAG: glycoside hydrolase family 2 TIM barrel-domain containing protein [Rikenellaceae bacterium]